MGKRYGLFVLAVVLVFCATWAQAVPVGCMGGATADAAKSAQLSAATLDNAFANAAKESGVPVAILKAVAKVETNTTQGGPSIDFGYGVMHLVDNSYVSTLKEAAALTGISEDVLKADAAANIRAGAALIAKYAKQTVGKPKNAKDYFAALKKFSGLINDQIQETQAQAYFKAMGVDASGLAKPRAAIKSTDYGPALWVASPNYNSRSGTAIDRWVNHWIATGTYAGAVSWFLNPASQVSAHFVCRNSDGELTQMVRIADRAWHCADWNSRGIGIEHEATSDGAYLWNSDPMLTAASAVCSYFCDAYGMPKTRTYIVGHKEVPNAATGCPGNLPWDNYMAMVNNQPTMTPTPTVVPGGQIVDNSDPGFAILSGAWSSGTTSADKYGPDYRFNTIGTGADQAQWSGNLADGDHAVYCWYPAGSNRATDAKYTVYYAGGSQVIPVNQQGNGGMWNLLGTFNFTAGVWTVMLSDNGVDGTKVALADAIKWVAVTIPTSTPTSPPADTPTNTPTTAPSNTPTNTPTITPTPAGIITIDDGDAGYTKSGSWTYTSNAGAEPLNADYDVTATVTGAATKWARWTPTIATAGNFNVYVRHKVLATKQCPDAPFTVTYNGGSQVIDVNQGINGGTWVLLGTFNFAAGTSGNVQLNNGPATKSKNVVADAVRFVPN